MPETPPSPFARGLGQWPGVAGAWLVYAAVLFATTLSILAATRILLGQKVAIVLFLAFLVLAECGLLVLVNGVVEVAVGALGGSRWGGRLLDAVKAAGLALLVTLPTLSLVKFRATGVHLKGSDLGFALLGLRQLGQEALPAEVRTFLWMVATFAVVALVSALALARLRRRPARLPAAQLLLLLLLAALGGGYTYRAYATVRSFAGSVLPELTWARQTLLAGGRFRRGGGGADPRLGGAPIAPYRPPAAPGRANVVLVMLESVPWGRTSLGGGPAGVTPNLDRLAAESVVFERAYTPSTHSDYAQMAILSSLHPRKFAYHDFYAPIEYPRALIWDALAPAGYRTAMFSCQNERWGNMLAYLDTRGLGLLRHSLDWPRAPHKGRGVESKVFEPTPVEAWERWRQADGGEPFFTYLNFQANHFPYEIPDDAPHPFAPWRLDGEASFFRYPRALVPVMLNRFDNALAYGDRYLGEVRAFLERRGEWERTVLVVVSDHGEAFYEHDEPTHGTSLYEEQVRSLLLLRLPGVAPRRVGEPVSLLDLAPTLLAYLGLPPHGNFQGRGDILAPGYDGAHRPIFFTIQGVTFEDGLLLGDRKYTVNLDRRYRRLFDLAVDPGEHQDLQAVQPPRTDALDRLLRTFLARQLAYYEGRGWEAGRYPPPLP